MLPAPLSARIGAWQPLTGGGLAAFAQAGASRLLLFQAAVALIGAVTVVRCLQATWFPVLEQAVLALPNSGAEIRSRRLLWPDSEAVLLASSPHLALAVDPDSSSQLGQNADLQLELRSSSLRFRGLLGQTVAPYPANFQLPLDRTGAKAAWGAWRLPILTLVGLATGIGLLLSGWLLALLYAPVLLVAATLIRRPLGLAGAWKLGLASLLPASLIMDSGLILYTRHWLGLTSLAAVFGLHFVAGWGAALWGLVCLSAESSPKARANPFGKKGLTVRSLPAAKPRNPFDS